MSVEEISGDWSHKDEWRKRGLDFLVAVTRHGAAEDSERGPHRWAVYAYIYPKHPHFAAFDGKSLWQDATSNMPLHGGCSLLEYPMYDGNVTSVKVSADYNHLGDENFTHCATPGDAHEVFEDAERLLIWLTSRTTEAAS